MKAMKKLGSERLKINYTCLVEATADIIGGKRKSVILFHLLFAKKRFGELQRLLQLGGGRYAGKH